MASKRQSPTNVRYLISLMPPQDIVTTSRELAAGMAASGAITAPMAPMLPLLESSKPPRPPVTGSLPHCRTPLVPAKRPVRDTDSPWWIWPVDSGGWFADLAAALESHALPSPAAMLYPLCLGIPLAADPVLETPLDTAQDTAQDTVQDTPDRTTIPDLSVLRWRALVLECHEIAFDPSADWYLDLRWRKLWRRRLRRAPELTNNNNHGDLA